MAGKMIEGPDGRYIVGTVKIGEKGQIVIPKDARNLLGLEPGDTLLVLVDRQQGIALVDNERFRLFAKGVLAAQEEPATEPTAEPAKEPATEPTTEPAADQETAPGSTEETGR